MKIICDSREKWTQPNSKDTHIKEYFDRHGIEYEVRALSVGDYMLEDGKVSIDRKSNLQEVATNLLNRTDRSRFWREVRRARESGIKLIVLCEHGGKIKSIEDVKYWRSEYSGVSGRRLQQEIYRVHISYGVEFLFCSKRSTAKRIIELLEGE